MSKHYREHTSQDPEVIAQRGRFRYKQLDVDVNHPLVPLNQDTLLPIIVFEDHNGLVLDTLTGQAALMPTTLTMHMRAVAAGRPIKHQIFEDTVQEVLRRMKSDVIKSRSIFSCPQ